MKRVTLKLALLATLGLGLAACDVAYPVAVIGEDGTMFRGAASNTFFYGGTFHATNGAVTCMGTYSKHNDIAQVSFPVQCTNGLRGIGKAQFETETRGSGEVVMTDGSRWTFLFGRGAGQI